MRLSAEERKCTLRSLNTSKKMHSILAACITAMVGLVTRSNSSIRERLKSQRDFWVVLDFDRGFDRSTISILQLNLPLLAVLFLPTAYWDDSP